MFVLPWYVVCETISLFYGKCPSAMRSCSREAWFAFSLTAEPEVTTPADGETEFEISHEQ